MHPLELSELRTWMPSKNSPISTDYQASSHSKIVIGLAIALLMQQRSSTISFSNFTILDRISDTPVTAVDEHELV
jgi:hypothetical protein